MKFAHFFLILLLVFVSSAMGESDLSLDDIILQIRDKRKSLNSYRTIYEISEIRKQWSDKSNLPDYDTKTAGTFVIDRNQGNFRDVKDRGHWYNATRKEWVYDVVKQGSYDKTRISLLGTSVVDNRSPAGNLRESRIRACGVYGPESYFGRLWGWPLDEFFEEIRDGIQEIRKTNDFKYTIIWISTEEGLEGVREEFTIDASKGWNLVSARGYRKTGELKYKYQMDYVYLSGEPFLKQAVIKEFTDPQDPDKLTNSVILTVDTKSVEINPILTKEDFRIDFPPGTYVTDARYNLQYKIPLYTESVYDIGNDPAILLMIENVSAQDVSMVAEEDNKGTSCDQGKDKEINNSKRATKQIIAATKNKAWDWRWEFIITLPALFMFMAILYLIVSLRRKRNV